MVAVAEKRPSARRFQESCYVHRNNQPNWLTYDIGGQRVGLSRYRIYAPDVGVFVSRDFLRYLNKYRCWSNDPVGQVDRNGLASADSWPRGGIAPSMPYYPPAPPTPAPAEGQDLLDLFVNPFGLLDPVPAPPDGGRYVGEGEGVADDPNRLDILSTVRAEFARRLRRWQRPLNCFYDLYRKMLEDTRNKLLLAFIQENPRVSYDLEPGITSHGRTYKYLNKIRLEKTGVTVNTMIDELTHVASSHYGGTWSDVQDHHVVSVLNVLLEGTMGIMEAYVAHKCQFSDTRQTIVKYGMSIETHIKASGGLATKLGLDFKVKKYLDIIDSTCCCGQGVVPKNAGMDFRR